MSTPRTPQQNGVAKRRNITLIDYARTLMIQKEIPHIFWREPISTDVYTLNRIQDSKSEPKDYKGFEYNKLVEPTEEDPVEVANEEACEVEPAQSLEEALRSELVLDKYVRNNHSAKNIIGDKDAGVLTRRRERENDCMLSIF
ncbi:hypothetical protein SUGI_0620890 [Cryptomeria japonica]|nr:hypothetical protein SUGI_0620890 [Cryptomeria japonica]